MYAKETQTDQVTIKDSQEEEEEEDEDKEMTAPATMATNSRHEDDTIEPDKEVTSSPHVTLEQK